LPVEDVTKLAAWLEEYQARVMATAEVFAMYDREESQSCNGGWS
jgi:hypothetical protein